MIKITVLGCGTSQGVPVIGCECEVCKSKDPRDMRTRTSIIVENESTAVCIDCGPDFRQQMLREGITHLDAVLITHHHKDHIGGLDDLRPLEFRQGISMPIYASEDAQDEIKREYSYAFVEKNKLYPGAPTFDLHTIEDYKPIIINDLTFIPVPMLHLKMLCYAFRAGSFAYVTDLSYVSEKGIETLKGVDYLIIEALHHEKHYSHINLEQAINLSRRIGARHTWFTHCSHHIGLAADVNKTLPKGMELAYDGLQIEVGN